MIQFGIMEQLNKLAAKGNVAAQQTLQIMMQQLQAQQGGGGEGGPPGPAAGPPGDNLSGTRSTDGTPTPQEEGRDSPGQSTLDGVEKLASAQPGLDGSVAG